MQSHIGSQPGYPQNSQKIFRMRVTLRNNCQFFRLHYTEFLPSKQTCHHCSSFYLIRLWIDHSPNAKSPHNVLRLNWRQVTLNSWDPNPHGSIDRDIHASDNYTSLSNRINRRRRDHLDLKNRFFLGILLSWNPCESNHCIELNFLLVRHLGRTEIIKILLSLEIEK